jgi:trehalose-6-phosphate synthase
MAELVVASNRGPVQFEVDDDGNLTAGRGAGGMVAALGPALAGQAGSWVAAAISEGDRHGGWPAPDGCAPSSWRRATSGSAAW